MRGKRTLLTLTLLAAAGLFTAGMVVAAGSTCPQGEIKIDGKKPARFSHKVHLDQGMECGVCHHDENHQPRTAEAIAGLADTKVLRCESCHNKDFANAKLQKRKNVFHGRCKSCHKEGYNGKKGPTKCNACHLKKKRKLEGC